MCTRRLCRQARRTTRRPDLTTQHKGSLSTGIDNISPILWVPEIRPRWTSRRTLPTQRSMIAFARGAWTGVLMTRIPTSPSPTTSSTASTRSSRPAPTWAPSTRPTNPSPAAPQPAPPPPDRTRRGLSTASLPPAHQKGSAVNDLTIDCTIDGQAHSAEQLDQLRWAGSPNTGNFRAP